MKKCNHFLSEIRAKNPLVLNLTNYVSMEFVANGLLALYASPIMSFAYEEMDDLLNLANALVINIGTLDNNFIDLAFKACKIAADKKVPIILDPVGAGATPLRTETSRRILDEFPIAIVRGNGSEILALAGENIISKGVDSSIPSNAAVQAGQYLSIKYGAVIGISGAEDFIISGMHTVSNHTGSPLMPQITGTGCLLTAVTAAFCAVSTDHFASTQSALWYFGKCGEHAEKNSAGPGSFRTAFLDALAKGMIE